MKIKKVFVCDDCGRSFETEAEALQCEADDRRQKERDSLRERWNKVLDSIWELSDDKHRELVEMAEKFMAKGRK